MQRQKGLCVSFIFLVVLGLAVSSAAQTETATLSGRVTDPSGAVVPGARVEVINIATNSTTSTETNAQGIYVVPNLRPGRYRIVVRKEGFKQIVKPGVVLHVQDIISHNFALEVGSVVQSVTVLAESGRMATSPAVGTVVDREFVENLPLNGRSFQQLITLTPGVVLTKVNVASGQGQFSVNGQRANANYFMVDGVSANVGISTGLALGQSAGGAVPGLAATGGTNSLVSVDAMQEFRIQTSTYAAEFGRQPGGQISIVTRSGTNDFHGTLFEYFRNDKLDANDWFANQQGLEKPPLRQNDFGGVLGGPIVPDKTFFFFSYEGLRLRQPQTRISLVPSVAARQAAPAAIQPLLNAFPLPNGTVFPSEFAEFSATYSNPSSLDATSIRVDHAVSEKLTFFGRYNHAPSENSQRGTFNSSLAKQVVGESKTQTLTLGGTYLIASAVSNEFRVNYSRSKGGSFLQLDDFGGAVPLSDSEVFPSFASSQDALFTVRLTGGESLSIGKNVGHIQRQVNLVDHLSVTKGAHQLKLGVDYRWVSPVSGPRTYDQSVFFSGLTGPNGALSGVARVIRISAKDEIPIVYHNLSLYGQDTWRVTPRLTLTYGLRWELNPPSHGKNGEGLFTVQGLEDPLNVTELAPAGTPLYQTTYNNFAPRVGVAYQLSQTPRRETVLRGGFGLFYDLGSGVFANAAVGFPNTSSKTLLNVPYPLTSPEADPPPFVLSPLSGNVYIPDPNLKLPRIYQWNVALEQSLGSAQTISASYVGAVGRRLLRSEVVFPTLTLGSLSITRNAATSDYHALQLQFKRRLSRGLQALASYTWSHSIDIASNDSGGNTAVGFTDPNVDRGSSDFDVRQSFSAAVTYNIPSPPEGGVGRAVLRDWSIDTIVTARSATPVNLIGGSSFLFRALGFTASPRPDLVPGEPLYVDDPTVGGGRRFNPAAFIQPQAGVQGTLGRSVLRGFRMSQVDFALRRQFNLTEKLNLQFRAELFNIFNHPNFGDPEKDLRSGFFGQSIQMLGRSLGTGGGATGGFNPLFQVGGPRSIQLALKLVF